MPVLDPLFSELPAQLDQLAISVGGKVDQSLERTLKLDAHAVEVQDRLQQLLFSALHRVARLLLAVTVLPVGAGTLDGVFGHAQLLLEVGPQGGKLCDLGHDRTHSGQFPVRLVDGVRAEPLHRSTILRSVDETAMRRRIAEARVARLATADAQGRPHVVPISFALDGDRIYFAVDAKPKRTSNLKRLRNIALNPAVSVLFDHYEEDWGRLWWVRVDGTARLVGDAVETNQAVDLLAIRYPQYRKARPVGPVVVISIVRMTGWSAA